MLKKAISYENQPNSVAIKLQISLTSNFLEIPSDGNAKSSK